MSAMRDPDGMDVVRGDGCVDCPRVGPKTTRLGRFDVRARAIRVTQALVAADRLTCLRYSAGSRRASARAAAWLRLRQEDAIRCPDAVPNLLYGL